MSLRTESQVTSCLHQCFNIQTTWNVLPWFIIHYILSWASQMAQTVKNLSAMQETQVQSLGQEDPLEKEMATHSSILTWEIPWTEEPGSYSSCGYRVGHDLTTEMKVAQSCTTLWDPMDYTIHGILQARIQEWVAFPFSRGSSQPPITMKVFLL